MADRRSSRRCLKAFTRSGAWIVVLLLLKVDILVESQGTNSTTRTSRGSGMDSGLAPAAIAGISVAGAVVFVAVAGIAIYCYIQGRKEKHVDDAKTTTPTVFSSEASRDVFPKRSKGGGYDNKAYDVESNSRSSVSSVDSTTGGRRPAVDLRPDHGDSQFGRQRSLKYAYFGQEAYDNAAYDSTDTTSARGRYPRGSETSQSEDDGPRADANSRPSRYDEFVRTGSGRRGRSAPPDNQRPHSPDRKISDDSVESVDTPSTSSNKGRRSYTPSGRASFSRGGYSRDARSMSMRSRSRSSGRKGPPRKRSSSTESKKEKERKELVRLMSGESSGLVKTGKERDAPPSSSSSQDPRRRSHRSRSGERRHHSSERSSRSRNYSESSYASDYPRDPPDSGSHGDGYGDYGGDHYSGSSSRSRSGGGHRQHTDRSRTYSEDSYAASERSGRPRSSTTNDVPDHRHYDYDNQAYSQV